MLAPYPPYEDRCYATAATKDDVNWNRDIIAKGEVVEHVHGEEQKYIWDPSQQRYSGILEVPRAVSGGEMVRPCK